MIIAEERDDLVMERIRNQKLACLLLAVIVMVSGICLDRVPANALFSCVKNTSIVKLDNTCKDMSVYRSENLSQREILNSIRFARKDARRSQTRATTAALCFSDADNLPQNFQSKQKAGEEESRQEILCSLAILTYIHNQDGEKAA